MESIIEQLMYNTSKRQNYAKITLGVAQGSVIGPVIWNANYDNILSLFLPEELLLFSFADDIAGVITTRNQEQVRRGISWAIRRVEKWLCDRDL